MRSSNSLAISSNMGVSTIREKHLQNKTLPGWGKIRECYDLLGKNLPERSQNTMVFPKPRKVGEFKKLCFLYL